MRLLLSYLIIASFPFFIPKEEWKQRSIAEVEYSEYCNPRYNFCVEYPVDDLPVKILSDNGDGIMIQSERQNFVATIAGSYGVQGRNTWDLYKNLVTDRLDKDNDDQVRYVIVTEDYYETMFKMGDRFLYQKLIHRGNKYILMELEGPSGNYYALRDLKEEINLKF